MPILYQDVDSIRIAIGSELDTLWVFDLPQDLPIIPVVKHQPCSYMYYQIKGFIYRWLCLVLIVL